MRVQQTYRVIISVRGEGKKAMKVRASSEVRAALAAVQQYRDAVAISVTYA